MDNNEGKNNSNNNKEIQESELKSHSSLIRNTIYLICTEKALCTS